MSDPFTHTVQPVVSNDEDQARLPRDSRRPSESWLNKPAWMDGSSDPPILFHSMEEINATLRRFGRNSAGQVVQHEEHSTPTPVALPAPAPLTPSLVPSATTHYHVEQPATVISTNVPRIPYYVQVTVARTVTIPATGRTKAATKKDKLTKMESIVLDGISRVDFLKEALKVHGLSSEYSPDFEIALEALFAKRGKVHVYADLDLDGMEGFRIRPMLPSTMSSRAGDENDELAYGLVYVPKVADFDEALQIQGTFILQLKQKWVCEKHQGEHGEPGHCYVNGSGAHIRLNPRRLKEWAAAWAAGEVTKHEPPNTASFDGARDGRLSSTKVRGQSGPRAPVAAPSTSDDILRFMASVGPALAEISHSPGRPVSKRSKVVSPLPENGRQLQMCLRQFFEAHNIDLMMHEGALAENDYSPDIIPFVADADLAVIFKVTNGIVLKFKKFCKQWFGRYEAKMAAGQADD
ncbi:hypothetical protein D9619_007649 [Psilocybe cf. subviscida]|uniref:Uncharacterized protein n=1 Tax=Psilocybe cf. subviscida TaxID=2480587 RepID=A0A8H5ESI7_9AGAR|nr:hypothetical protein D9619_007649 [Psilocybe cf. subviscida]